MLDGDTSKISAMTSNPRPPRVNTSALRLSSRWIEPGPRSSKKSAPCIVGTRDHCGKKRQETGGFRLFRRGIIGLGAEGCTDSKHEFKRGYGFVAFLFFCLTEIVEIELLLCSSNTSGNHTGSAANAGLYRKRCSYFCIPQQLGHRPRAWSRALRLLRFR